MGERPAGANKWLRFRKEFPIQSNIDVDSISAKFEGANLVVRLPRPEPIVKPILPSGTTIPKPPPGPKESLKLPSPAAKVNLKLPSPVAKEPGKVQPPKPTREKELSELAKPVENLQPPKPSREEEAARAKKEEALKVEEKRNGYEGILNQGYRTQVNAYKENLGGYVALMKNNRTAITAGMVAPAIAVLLLSLGFYAGRMFTSY